MSKFVGSCPECGVSVVAPHEGMFPYNLFGHMAKAHKGFAELVGFGEGLECSVCGETCGTNDRVKVHLAGHYRIWRRVLERYQGFPVPKKFRDKLLGEGLLSEEELEDSWGRVVEDDDGEGDGDVVGEGSGSEDRDSEGSGGVEESSGEDGVRDSEGSGGVEESSGEDGGSGGSATVSDRRGAGVRDGADSSSEENFNQDTVEQLDTLLHSDKDYETVDKHSDNTQNVNKMGDRGIEEHPSPGGGKVHMNKHTVNLEQDQEAIQDIVRDIVESAISEKDTLKQISTNLQGINQGQEEFKHEVEDMTDGVKETVTEIKSEVDETAGKINETAEEIRSEVDQLDEKIDETASRSAEEREKMLKKAERDRLEDIQAITQSIDNGFDKFSERLSETFREKREPDDAVTRDQFEKTLTKVTTELQKNMNETFQNLKPAMNVAQNMTEAVGEVSCDNCEQPVTFDEDQCPHCGAEIYWEL